MFIRNKQGLTVIEVLVAIAVLGIASMGAMSYQYFSNRHMRNAQVKITATQITQLLIEDWKSVGGDEHYSPLNLGLGFTVVTGSSDTYELLINDVRLRISLFWQEVMNDVASGIALRQIGVRTRWRTDLSHGSLESDFQQLDFTTYVRRDAGGD
ncbi:MAG TPA: prepilin-type N-terminal cleavage/methylation domain-containing protein [Sedimentisphaerales bacterium]|nr:prepilin-type N-terminal cleavage/methylation domain-containing protein [Sedimentisphaerales bacterium]